MVMYMTASCTNTASKRAAEPYRAHVALPMLAVGIERGADREHAGRRVDLWLTASAGERAGGIASFPTALTAGNEAPEMPP